MTVRMCILVSLLALAPAALTTRAQADDIDAEALFRRGLMQFGQERMVSAQLDFNDVVKGYPGNPWSQPAMMMLAKTFYNLGDYEAAENTARELRETYPAGPYSEWTDYLVAAAAFRRGDTGRAAELLASLVRTTADSSLAGYALDALRHTIYPASDRQMFKDIMAQYGLAIDDLAEVPAPDDALPVDNRWEPQTAIRIGLLAPLTGPFAAEGADLREGVEAAFGGYETIDGLPVELIVEDTASDPIQAVMKTRSLIAQNVVAVIGPVYGESTIPAAVAADAAGVPFLVPTAADVGISLLGPRVFQLNPTPAVQGAGLAAFAYDTLGARTAAVLATDDWWGRAVELRFGAEFTARGGRVCASERFNPADSRYNLHDTIMAIRGSAPEGVAMTDSLLIVDYGNAYPDTIVIDVDPALHREQMPVVNTIDCVLISADYGDADNIAAQIRDYQIETQLLGDTGWSGGLMYGAPSPFMEGAMLVATIPITPGNLGSPLYTDDFNARLLELHSMTARKGYDAAALLVHCLLQGARTPSSLTGALSLVRDFRGLTTRIAIDPETRLNTAVDIVLIDNGIAVPVTNVSAAPTGG